MRFFSLLDFQHMVLAVFLGLSGLLLIYLAWVSYPKGRKKDEALSQREFFGSETGAEKEPEKNPIGPALILIYAEVLLWALAYVLFVGVWGKAIG